MKSSSKFTGETAPPVARVELVTGVGEKSPEEGGYQGIRFRAVRSRCSLFSALKEGFPFKDLRHGGG